MKVLEINSVYHFGSTGKIVEDLQNYLVNHNNEVEVIYGRKRGNYSAKYVGNTTIMISDVIMSLLLDRHGLNNKLATKRIIKIIESFDPDIIHLHNIHGFYLSYDVLLDYLTKKNKKVVITLHDCWLLTGFCSHFEQINCEEWKTNNCRKCNVLKVYPYRFFALNHRENFLIKKEKLLAIKNLTLISPSEWMDSIVCHSFLKNKSHYVINNGINLEKFFPENHNKIIEWKRKLNVENKKVLLGVANVWNKQKGLEDFQQLCTLLDDEYVIILVGTNLIQKKKVKKKIICLPRTESIEELRLIYSSAEYFVNFTYQDTFPTVNIEALACGTPIISYRTGGCAEIVKDCGYLLEKGEFAQVPSLLKRNIKFNEDKCVTRARAFDKKIMLRKYMNLFNGLI